MSGIDKILTVIENQSKQNADAVINAAQKKAKAISSEGNEEAKKAHDQLIEKCVRDCETEYINACSAIDAAMKREILACKVHCINMAVERALNKISELPDDEYFAIILKLIGTHLRKGCGILSFGVKDLARIPSDFEKNVNLLAGIDGSSVKLSNEPADIENGFKLSYGDISENCSFSAIAEEKKDAISDKAAAVLFA